MSKEDRMYKNPPTVENGKVKKNTAPKNDVKPDETQAGAIESESAESGMPPEVRHRGERRETKHRHIHEHHAMHHKHEVEHSVHEQMGNGSKKEMHARHEKELGDMHDKHEKEIVDMHTRQEKELGK